MNICSNCQKELTKIREDFPDLCNDCADEWDSPERDEYRHQYKEDQAIRKEELENEQRNKNNKS